MSKSIIFSSFFSKTPCHRTVDLVIMTITLTADAIHFKIVLHCLTFNGFSAFWPEILSRNIPCAFNSFLVVLSLIKRKLFVFGLFTLHFDGNSLKSYLIMSFPFFRIISNGRCHRAHPPFRFSGHCGMRSESKVDHFFHDFLVDWIPSRPFYESIIHWAARTTSQNQHSHLFG